MKKRNITNKLIKALADSPVILLHGARQTGKSTLVRELLPEHHKARYLTFDDSNTLAAAENNPEEFIESFDENIIIDEVQRVPDLFIAIKKYVDKKRKSGKFIITGSANPLLLPKISESLTGRIEILNMFPFSQNEVSGSMFNLVDVLFNKRFVVNGINSKKDVKKRILTGGYPEVNKRKTNERREAWFNSYLNTIIQRDIRDIANIERLGEFPRLLRILAARAGTLLNFAELSRSSAIAQTSLKRYVALLETIFLLQFVPAWSGNFSKRSIKAPKVFMNDTGLLSYLVGFSLERILTDQFMWGRVFENFVANELTKQISWSKYFLRLFHYRSASGQEIDFIIEKNDGSLVGIEAKASNKITAADFKHMKVFAEEQKDKFVRGIVLYTGEEVIPFAKNLYALPIKYFWS